MFSIGGLFTNLTIRICDIGASPIEGNLMPYRQLVEDGLAEVIGFEPNVAEWRKFNRLNHRPNVKCLPYAIGDGSEGALYKFDAPGMASLLQPNMDLLNFFLGFDQWCQPRGESKIKTLRLDDVADLGDIDYLKLDTQGSELAILQNATKMLEKVLVIHTEVPFLPVYHGQPLFGDIDAFLRERGFVLHCFSKASNRQFVALPFGPLEQVLEADAVYVRDFAKWDDMGLDSLKKMSVIMHNLYGSCGLTAMALQNIDRRINTKLYQKYVELLRGATK